MPEYILMRDSGETRAIAHHPPRPMTRLREAYAGQAFDDFGIIKSVRHTPEVTLYAITVRDAVLSFLPGLEGVVATSDGRLIRETTFLTEEADRPRVLDGLSGAVPLDRPVLHATDAWFRNFYHWLVIALGKSLVADRCLPPEVASVFPAAIREPLNGAKGFSPRVYEQTLARFSTGRPRLFLGPGLYRVPELHLLWTQHGHSEFHMVLPEFHAPFQAAAAAVRGGQPKKVLVLRRDDLRMSVADQAVLIEAATGFGYRPVHLEDWSFEDELRLFADATHVVGAHGSGMANIVFCRPGTCVLELNKDLDGLGYLRPWIYLLADAAGHEYRYLTRFKGEFTAARFEEAFARMEA